jgi:hypothetical protein
MYAIPFMSCYVLLNLFVQSPDPLFLKDFEINPKTDAQELDETTT